MGPNANDQDSSGRRELSKNFPISKWRIVRRSFSYLLVLCVTIVAVTILDRLGQKVYRIEPKTFSLIGVGIILLAVLATLGKIIYESADLLLCRYYLQGNEFVLARGVFRPSLKRLPLSMSQELTVVSSLLDRLFGLSSIEIPHLKESIMEFSIEGLKRSSAQQLHELLVSGKAPEQPSKQQTEQSTGGAAMSDKNFAPVNSDPQKQLERSKAEKENLEKETAKKQEELKQIQAKQQTTEELQKIEDEKKHAAEQLKATEEELKRAKDKQAEEDRVNEAKKQLAKTRHELELIREEKEVKEELRKTEQELEAERAKLQAEQKKPAVEGQPGGTFHR